MKLSTRSRYGTRLMIYLALNYGRGVVFLKEIAGKEGLSEKYLGQIIIPLKSAGLVISERGASGGYALGRSPENITLKDIVEVLEGGIELVDCIRTDESCVRAAECITREIWTGLSETVKKYLEALSLDALAAKARERQGSLSGIDYHI